MFRIPTDREIQALRVQFPAGTRVKLIKMDDPYTHLKPGDWGTVQGVDDAGQIMINWDSGGSLSLIPGEDIFQKEERV